MRLIRLCFETTRNLTYNSLLEVLLITECYFKALYFLANHLAYDAMPFTLEILKFWCNKIL